jgi:hypothetical protein
MVTVAVSGASGRTGRRLIVQLNRDPDVERVVPFDGVLPTPELKRELDGVDVVIHLGPARTVGPMLEAAGSVGPTPTFIYRSSASVYGAWADNAVPLTEDIPLRPNPRFSFAVEHAEAERLVGDWKDNHPGTIVAVLRPAPVVAPGGESWESNTLGRPSTLRRGETLPPAQFLHVEDAAAAFAHVFTKRLAGTFNIAPDGFVGGETARALARSGLTLPLPDRVAKIAERWAWTLGWAGGPPEAAPYREHPWVVANDRLRAEGWAPEHTNEEALVATQAASWRDLSPRRRQELALGGAGLTLAGAAAGAVALIRRSRRRG